ncbi:MAG: hypothetical protein C4293_14765, partial [Nitrospiraceae bacterium]
MENDSNREIERLRLRISALEQLLAAYEQTVLEQATRIESAMQRASDQAEALHAIVAGTAVAIGKDFFHSLVSHLASVLKVRYAVIGELKDPGIERIRTLAVWADKGFAENCEYDLRGTPCEQVIHRKTVCHHPRGVQQLFPHDRVLAEMEVESYWGAPLLLDEAGRPLGLLVVMHDQPLPFAESITQLSAVFAARAGAELKRKRAEEALRDSESRYRLFFESNPHPMWVYDRETLSFLAVNGAAVAHYGYSEDEFLAMTIKDIRPPEDVPALLDHLAKVTTDFNLSGNWRHRKKDGTIIDVDISRHALNFRGRPAELILVHDMTDRKRAEEALRRSEEQFASFMDNLPGFAWIKDARGKYVYANRYFQETFGVGREQCYGKTDVDIFPPDTAAQCIDNDRQVMQTGRESGTIETFRLKDGLHYGLVRKFPVFDRSGRQMSVAGISVDITDLRRAEETLRAASERLLKQEFALLDLIQCEAFTPDPDVALQQITEVAARTLNVERASIWRYAEDRSRIRCIDLYELSKHRHSAGAELQAASHPAYFHALATSKIIVANDAHQDARTRELSKAYLSPLGISALMDVPIRFFGRLEGVLCHEVVGSRRQWMQDEQIFATAMVSLVTLAYERWERKRAEQALQESESALRSFFNSSPLMMGTVEVLDDELLHISGNAASARFFGTTDEAMQNRRAGELGIPETIVRNWVERCRESERRGGPVRFEYDRETPDGVKR